MNLSTTIRQLSRIVNKNSPAILTGLGIAGFVTTVVMAVKSTPMALHVIEAEKEFRREEEKDETPLTPQEIVELTWKFYAPATLMGVASITCVLASHHISRRRNAAIASLFSITENALREYQSKVVAEIGEKKEQKIQAEISQDHLDRNPPSEATLVVTSSGDSLVYDDFSGRYFRSSIEKIKQTVNEFNRELLLQDTMTLNEFYQELGLDTITMGDEMGWRAERGLVEVHFDAKIAKGGEPCAVMKFKLTIHNI